MCQVVLHAISVFVEKNAAAAAALMAEDIIHAARTARMYHRDEAGLQVQGTRLARSKAP